MRLLQYGAEGEKKVDVIKAKGYQFDSLVRKSQIVQFVSQQMSLATNVREADHQLKILSQSNISAT